jgi:hypothetical protein
MKRSIGESFPVSAEIGWMIFVDLRERLPTMGVIGGRKTKTTLLYCNLKANYDLLRLHD